MLIISYWRWKVLKFSKVLSFSLAVETKNGKLPMTYPFSLAKHTMFSLYIWMCHIIILHFDVSHGHSSFECATWSFRSWMCHMITPHFTFEHHMIVPPFECVTWSLRIWMNYIITLECVEFIWHLKLITWSLHILMGHMTIY